jgi:hypothetical protein
MQYRSYMGLVRGMASKGDMAGSGIPVCKPYEEG